jgi:tRNA A-37 threonylcarbamoyl transferase component Bud32
MKRNIFIKQNVTKHEYMCHKMIYNLKKFNVPRIYSYDEKTQIMVLQKIHGLSLSDFYGEDSKNISNELFAEIRKIVEYLYNMDIIYEDITGYNFIYYQDKLWIFDFEHVKFGSKYKNTESFVNKFINGHNGWNPNYK